MTETLYQLGVRRETMPAPLIAEHCLDVPAGPLRFVLESRNLVADMARLRGTIGDDPNATVLDDGGSSVHVFGTGDGVEHLRFDCFETYPHYHYIRAEEQQNLIVRIDEIAIGDPVAWTIERLRLRLPEMLEFVSEPGLARGVRDEWPVVAAAIDELSELLDAARSSG